MKRFVLMLLALFLLAGCTRNEVPMETTATSPSQGIQSTVSWVETAGMAWDTAGVLKEIPLTIPDGFHYTAAREFDGDLLLWSTDSHLPQKKLELCLVELDDGSVIAQRDLPMEGYIYPQCLGDTLYLCDGTGGQIKALDKNLEIREQWEIEPTEDSLHMGEGGILYRNTQESTLYRCDLNTGESLPLLEGDPKIGWINTSMDDTIAIRYYRPENGMTAYCVLDLTTGEIFTCDADSRIDSVSMVGDFWLYEKYASRYVYFLHTGGNEYRISPENMTITFLDEGYILGTSMDFTVLTLYDMEGRLLSRATISENELGYISNDMIWSERYGGYFFVFRSYEETSRLLFWDISRGTEGEEHLALEAVLEPDADQVRLEIRAQSIGDKYGVVILLGTQCDTEFDEFTAQLDTDYDRVEGALDTLERALSAFPAPFLRQLRYGEMQSIRIHLVKDLQATGGGKSGGGYSAFTQNKWDHTIMVVDTDVAVTHTYFHEFSHIIDRYLEWDAEQRPNAVFSETAWASMNPAWFDGYTQDYAVERTLWSDDAFVDGYATISPTEDRARVLEYAMAENCQGTFEEGSILSRKLEYYCRCLRDAFATDGWADTPRWEQYLW